MSDTARPMEAAADRSGTSAAKSCCTRRSRKSRFAQLRVGDVVIINGEMHTGRDALHKYLMDHDAPVDLNGAVIYHCGPVMLKDEAATGM